MIEIHNDGALLFSALPGGVNRPLTIEMRGNPQAPNEYQGFALLEFQAAGSQDVYVDVSVPQGNTLVALYGQLEDIHLKQEDRKPVGVRCSFVNKKNDDSFLQGWTTFIVIDIRDVNGNALRTLNFQFNVKPARDEALFRMKPFGSSRVERLPEFKCEPGVGRNESFELETLQSSPNLVSYSTSAGSPAGAPFAQTLIQTANSYVHPNGPLVGAAYFGSSGIIGESQVFFIEASAANGSSQKIPFISWVVDTPGLGELKIAAIESDPRGADEPSESITLENTGTRVLNLNGCTIVDKQAMSLLGLPLNLPYGQPRTHVLPPGTRLQPGGRLTVNPDFVMNNDFDAFLLRSRMGRDLDFSGYLRRLPGDPPPNVPRQRNVFRASVSLDGNTDQIQVRFTDALEDGDLVIIRPDPASRLWAGDLGHPPTGPEGWIRGVVPPGWSLPLPSAPLYALLLMDTPEPRLIGNVPKVIVIDRESDAKEGLKAGMTAINFQRNDPFAARWFNWGKFDIEVRVMRH